MFSFNKTFNCYQQLMYSDCVLFKTLTLNTKISFQYTKVDPANGIQNVIYSFPCSLL